MSEKSVSLRDLKIKLSRDVLAAALDNGVRTFIYPRAAADTVSVQAWIATGSIHEGEHLGCGLSHFLEHMLFQGSRRYPGTKVSDVISSLGGEFNAYTSFSHTVYYVNLPASHVGKSIDVLTDMIRFPLFPEARFQGEKEVILRERDMVRDNPARVLLERLWNSAFLVHPVRHPVIGYADRIRSVDRDLMSGYYRRRYTPGNCFFVVCGKINPGKVFKLLEQRLADWEPGCLAEPALPTEPSQQCARKLDCFFKDPLCRIAVGYKMPPVGHEDIPALDVLCGILGEDKSSRLVRRLHDKEETAVSIGASGYAQHFGGLFAVTAACVPEKAGKLEKGISEEIEKLCSGLPEKRELEREIIQQSTEFIRGLNHNSTLGRIIGSSVMTFGAPGCEELYLEKLTAMTAAEVRTAACKYLAPEASAAVRMFPENRPPPGNAAVRKCSRREECAPAMLKLASGTRIITYLDRSLPLIELCVVLPGGSLRENRGNAGITRLTAALLTTGTRKYSEEKFARLLDDNAIDFEPLAGGNSLILRFNFRKDRLRLALNIVAGILHEPAFAARQFGREKKNTLELLKCRALNPQNAAEDKMNELLFNGHPYGMPRYGYHDSIAGLTADSLREFYHHCCLNAPHAVFAAAGDFNRDELTAQLTKCIAAVAWNSTGAPDYPPPPVFPSGPLSGFIEMPREQAVVMLAVPGCDNYSDDRFALDLLQAASNHMASELFRKIREDAALAYYTAMTAFRGFQRGLLAFYAGCSPANADKTMRLLRNERERLAEKGIELREFKSGLEAIRFANASNMESPGVLIMNSAISEFYGGGFRLPWEMKKIFSRMEYAETCDIINKYMKNEAVITVTAGPPQTTH